MTLTHLNYQEIDALMAILESYEFKDGFMFA